MGPWQENVSLSMIGLDAFPANTSYLAYTRDLAQVYPLNSDGIVLPQQTSNQFSILYLSPVIKTRSGTQFVLLGELGKLGVVSPVRIEDLDMGEDTISILLSG